MSETLTEPGCIVTNAIYDKWSNTWYSVIYQQGKVVQKIHGSTQDDAEEKARLFNASGDLLDGLKFSLALFKAEGIDSDHRIFGGNISMIEAAIKKATKL